MDRRLPMALEVQIKEEVERFMASGKHFSHHHPLSLTIPSEEDEEEDDDKSCSICGLPILSSPSFKCTTISCKFFLHKQCALELPHFLLLPAHCAVTRSTGHALYLHKPNLSRSFNYSCKYCGIKIHPLSAGVGVKIEIKIKHRSHPSHPLVATGKEVSCECDGCGRKQEGFFFTCHVCNFWIHQDCTLLPNIITLLDQPYPFFLAYSLPPYQIMTFLCLVCQNPLNAKSSNLGVYLCPQSGTFAHVDCGTHHRSASKTRAEVMMQLPEEERGEFPSRAIRRCAESIVGTSTADADAAHDLKIESYHKQHPLILISNNATTSSSSSGTKKKKKKQLLACDLCTQPIDTSSSSSSSSSSFHRCENRACQFAAHSICADILPNITKFFVPGFGGTALDVDILLPNNRPRISFFNSVFYCSFCRRPCNGACPYVHSPVFDDYSPWCIDIECMAAPITVSHASHPRHLLFRTHHMPSSGPRLPCCAAHTSIYDVYRCITCDYVIHMSCAMLPKRIHFPQYHRLHPLYLIYDTTAAGAAADDDDGLFCEVCEKGIDLRYWMYRCVECDEWYHINCIPSVGYLSKVKFGGTLTLPSSVHAHPLTLERMLDVPSQRCGDCKGIIHGMVDRMAFFCSLCHFWLHFSCAGKSARRLTSDHPPLLYSEVRRLLGKSILMSIMGLQ